MLSKIVLNYLQNDVVYPILNHLRDFFVHFLFGIPLFNFWKCSPSLKNAAKRSRQHARIKRRLSSNWTDTQRGGRTHNVTQRTDTHIFTKGGTHPQFTPTNGHTYFHRGGGRTHNVTQQTDTKIIFDETNETKLTNGQSHILRQHAA